VSALELARFMTPKAKVVPSGGYGIGTGMTRMFGMDADAQIKAQSDRLIRAAGIPTNDTKYTNNMPDVLKGSGVPTWRTIRSSRPLQDYNILTSLAASKLEEGTANNYSITSSRPQEGDLLYFPMVDKLFEIKFVEDEAVFYQMGELQTYDLKCEAFEYSHERLDTGIAAIDDLQTDHSAVMQDFQLLDEASNILVFEDGSSIIAEDYRVDSIKTTANNEYFQAETRSTGSLGSFLDFSESNPFSEGGSW